MFDSDHFKENLNTQWLGANFIFRELTDSTNTDLKKIPSDKLIHGTVLLAENQRRGRGQYSRNWLSEPGHNLTFTLALRPAEADRLPLLTLAAGWAIIRTLKKNYQFDSFLKLPNDILVSGKKIAGILTENIFYGSKLDRVLIGIGLNVNQSDFSPEITHATSVYREFGTQCDREILLAKLLLGFEDVYRRWKLNEKELILDINRSIEGYGEWVSIIINNKPEEEKVKLLGVNELGHLLILTKEFEVKEYTHEQVRIRHHYKAS